MHTTSTATAAGRTALAAVLLLALGACGSETPESSDGDTGTGADGAFDVATATLPAEPFCDQVDTAMVAEVLGMSADKVRVQVDRAVGDEFEGPVDEGTPPTSEANLCIFGSSTSQFTVSVQPDASAEDVQAAVDELESLAGESSSEQCEPTDAAEFGDPAGAFTCTSNPPIKRVRVVATGLVGDSKFYCGAALNTGAGPELPEATFGACRTLLEELASAS
jgi:hypothetical protein